MSFISEAISEFTHRGSNQQQQQQQPSNLPPGWIARWDSSRQCYFYINERTGEETLQYPGPPQGSYQQQGESYQGNYQGQYEEPQRQQGHGMAYGAMGAAAGLVGGALLMHEGEKVGE